MTFDIKNTSIFQAVKIERFLLFKYAKILKETSLYLFIVSLSFIVAAFFGYISEGFALKLPILFLVFYIIFFEINLFLNLKIRKPEIGIKI